jgi:hypothetical protein
MAHTHGLELSSLFQLEGIGDCEIHRCPLSVVVELQVGPLTILPPYSIGPLLVSDHHPIVVLIKGKEEMFTVFLG